MFKRVNKLTDTDKKELREARVKYREGLYFAKLVPVYQKDKTYNYYAVMMKASDNKNYTLSFIKEAEFNHEYGIPLIDTSYFIDTTFIDGCVNDDYTEFLLDAGHGIYITKQTILQLIEQIQEVCTKHSIHLPKHYNEDLYNFLQAKENAKLVQDLKDGIASSEDLHRAAAKWLRGNGNIEGGNPEC